MESISFTVWVTSDCNMCCDYCYEGEKQPRYMSRELIPDIVKFINRKIIEFAVQECRVRFHGGEPLINDKVIWNLIENIKNIEKKVRFHFSITTNAYHLAEGNKLALLSNFDDITISIDGSKQTHDAQRKNKAGKGTFDRSFNNALELLNIGANITIRMTITLSSLRKLSENVFFLIECGFRKIRPIMDFCERNWEEEHFEMYEDQVLEIRNFLEKNDIARGFDIALVTPTRFVRRKDCNGGESSFQIDTNGDIYPCEVVVGKSECLCGNVVSGIDESWKDQLDAINSTEIKTCIGCTFKEYCTGYKCKFINYAQSGKFDCVSSSICEVSNLIYKLNKDEKYVG